MEDMACDMMNVEEECRGAPMKLMSYGSAMRCDDGDDYMLPELDGLEDEAVAGGLE